MSKYVSLSTNQKYDLVGVIYDYLEKSSSLQFNDDDYEKIQDSVIDLLEQLNA
jgi:hypothetical protein